MFGKLKTALSATKRDFRLGYSPIKEKQRFFKYIASYTKERIWNIIKFEATGDQRIFNKKTKAFIQINQPAYVNSRSRTLLEELKTTSNRYPYSLAKPAKAIKEYYASYLASLEEKEPAKFEFNYEDPPDLSEKFREYQIKKERLQLEWDLKRQEQKLVNLYEQRITSAYYVVNPPKMPYNAKLEESSPEIKDKISDKKKEFSVDEAMKILGFTYKPTRDEIQERLERITELNDPEKGGSSYIQAKAKQASERLELALSRGHAFSIKTDNKK
eukprot:TRINITY_DN3631_c0_g1_i1.p1 TRINITY_DN3631_c0_g1~~TRINITY_DN3631_c0_g1_i1.p1  ORF type:complete len:272 (+),score=57.69 TRINITY_DN3631_c0_g1_i1:17-832(+)